MNMVELPAAAVSARKARYRRDLGELDYRRSVVRLRMDGASQTAIAAMIEVAQPTVQRLLQRAEAITMPRVGFSGADPFEICERYAADLITHDQLMDELTRWEYVPRAQTVDVLDDLLDEKPGSVADLERALRRGLIDEETFDEIADRLEEQAQQA